MSLVQEVDSGNTMYLTIVGWNMVQKVEEGTPGAKKREYEDSNGNKGVKFEKHFKNLTGYITELNFRDTDFGTQLWITVVSWDDTAKLSISTNSNYFSDFAKKLPNIDLYEKVELNPFDFESNGKKLRGMSVKCDGQKVENYYWDAEKKEAINWIPTVEDTSKMTKNKWKSFFLDVEDFLVDEVKKIEVPQVERKSEGVVDDNNIPAEDLSIEDLPF